MRSHGRRPRASPPRPRRPRWPSPCLRATRTETTTDSLAARACIPVPTTTATRTCPPCTTPPRMPPPLRTTWPLPMATPTARCCGCATISSRLDPRCAAPRALMLCTRPAPAQCCLSTRAASMQVRASRGFPHTCTPLPPAYLRLAHLSPRNLSPRASSLLTPAAARLVVSSAPLPPLAAASPYAIAEPDTHTAPPVCTAVDDVGRDAHLHRIPRSPWDGRRRAAQLWPHTGDVRVCDARAEFGEGAAQRCCCPSAVRPHGAWRPAALHGCLAG